MSSGKIKTAIFYFVLAIACYIGSKMATSKARDYLFKKDVDKWMGYSELLEYAAMGCGGLAVVCVLLGLQKSKQE